MNVMCAELRQCPPSSMPMAGGIRRKFAAILDSATPVQRYPNPRVLEPTTVKQPTLQSRHLGVTAIGEEDNFRLHLAAPTPESDGLPRKGANLRARNAILDSATPAPNRRRRRVVELEDDESSPDEPDGRPAHGSGQIQCKV